MIKDNLSETIHANCVCVGNQAVLITGPSGAGKSTLSLEIMSRGGRLVADDQTIVTNRDGVLLAKAPQSIAGQIEARGVGLLAVDTVANIPIRLVVDLEKKATGRLPKFEQTKVLGISVALIKGKGNPNLAPAIIAYLKGGRSA